MKTNSLRTIENQSDKLLLSLREKYPLLLKRLAISVLSEKNFQKAIHNKKDNRHIYFTKDELDYCKNRISSLAGRYATKIAINQTLDEKIPLKNINISSSQTGEPVLSFSNAAKPAVAISISHEEDIVAAFAALPVPNKKIAIGIDAASISRMSSLLTNKKIMQKILTPRELEEINENPSAMPEKWAGKEAVSKAIGIGIWHGASLREIEIINYRNKPTVNLYGKILQQAQAKGINTWILNFIKNQKLVLAVVLAAK